MDNVSLPTRHYYERMSAAMNATGRPMVFSICSWGLGEPHLWGADVGHSWRTDTDLFAVWDEPTARGVLRLPKMFGSVMAAVERQAHLAPYARRGGFNDLDMLVVGLSGMSAYGTVDPSDCPPHLPSSESSLESGLVPWTSPFHWASPEGRKRWEVTDCYP